MGSTDFFCSRDFESLHLALVDELEQLEGLLGLQLGAAELLHLVPPALLLEKQDTQ